jgi:hypothetical protein
MFPFLGQLECMAPLSNWTPVFELDLSDLLTELAPMKSPVNSRQGEGVDINLSYVSPL